MAKAKKTKKETLHLSEKEKNLILKYRKHNGDFEKLMKESREFDSVYLEPFSDGIMASFFDSLAKCPNINDVLKVIPNCFTVKDVTQTNVSRAHIDENNVGISNFTFWFKRLDNDEIKSVQVCYKTGFADGYYSGCIRYDDFICRPYNCGQLPSGYFSKTCLKSPLNAIIYVTNSKRIHVYDVCLNGIYAMTLSSLDDKMTGISVCKRNRNGIILNTSDKSFAGMDNGEAYDFTKEDYISEINNAIKFALHASVVLYNREISDINHTIEHLDEDIKTYTCYKNESQNKVEELSKTRDSLLLSISALDEVYRPEINFEQQNSSETEKDNLSNTSIIDD